MKKCQKCGINVDTTRKTCPLCFNLLVEVNEESSRVEYPSPDLKDQKPMIDRVFLFIGIVAASICVLVNFLTYNTNKSFWSIIVLASILGLFLFIVNLKVKVNALKKIGNIALILSGYMYVINATVTKSFRADWAINYVIPFILATASISVSSVLAAKARKFRDYLLSFLFSMLIGTIPLIIYLCDSDLIYILWPSLVSACLSVIMIIGTLFLGFHQTKEEIKKRLHI